MSMDWGDAFEGPLSEYLTDGTAERVQVPWPALDDADDALGQLVLEDPKSAFPTAENALAELGYEAAFRVFDLPDRRTYRVGKYGSDLLGTLIGVHGKVVASKLSNPLHGRPRSTIAGV